MVQRLHIGGDDLAVFAQAQVRVDHVVRDREIGAVELQHEAGIDDGAVLARHDVGEREQVFLFGLVVAVLEIARDLAGGGRGEEVFFGLGTRGGALGLRDVGYDGGKIPPRDRAGAGWAVLKRRGELLEDQRQFGKLGLAGAERRCARPLEARQAILDVNGVVQPALFAVVDNVEASLDLFLDHAGDGLRDGVGERGLPGAGRLPLREHQFHYVRRARQAAGVGGENALFAGFHGLPPSGTAMQPIRRFPFGLSARLRRSPQVRCGGDGRKSRVGSPIF